MFTAKQRMATRERSFSGKSNNEPTTTTPVMPQFGGLRQTRSSRWVVLAGAVTFSFLFVSMRSC